MSSNTTIAPGILHLQSVAQYLAAISGLTLFICGIIGNILNILTFYMLGNWKNNASSLYLLVKSVLDLVCLFPGLMVATFNYGLRIDLLVRNRVWCRLRFIITAVTMLTSLTCVCLQSIDVFFCSSYSQALRKMSSVRVARYLMIGSLVFWSAHTIPSFLFIDIVQRGNTLLCTIINSYYSQYTSYAIYVGFYSVIPITIISVFGYLTYRNLKKRTTNNRCLLPSISRQMISMAFFQIGNIFLFQGPFGIMFSYSATTASLSKDAYRQAQEQVARTLVVVIVFGAISV